MATGSNNKIGLIGAIILCMNAMIGAGIFATPAVLASSAGPGGILAYFFVIIAVLFLALSLAQLAKTYPEEGSFYLYAKQWSGKLMGLIASGSYIKGINIVLGLLIQITAVQLNQFFPSISVGYLGLILIGIIYFLTLSGPKVVQVGQAFFVSCTLFSIISTIILCILNADTQNLVPFTPYGITPIIMQMTTAIFSFYGFETITALYKKIDNPNKNIPKAVIFSLAIVGLLYLTFIGSITLAIPASVFTSAKMPLSQALLKVYPQYSWLAKLIALSTISALCGVLQSLLYAISNLSQTFLQNLNWKITNPITRSSYSYEIILTIVTLTTILISFSTNKLGIFFNLASIFVTVAFVLSIITLVVKQRERKSKIIPILGLATGVVILAIATYGFLKEIM